MESQYDPELQEEISRRRNSGDLRYDFVNDEWIAKEILKERVQKDGEIQTAKLLETKITATPRDPEELLKRICKALDKSEGPVPPWNGWFWRFDIKGDLVDMCLSLNRYPEFQIPEFQKKYVDENVVNLNQQKTWSSTIQGIDFLLAYLRGRRVVSIVDPNLDNKWYLKIVDENPAPPVSVPESVQGIFSCINGDRCIFPGGKIKISDKYIGPINGYQVGDMLKAKPGVTLSTFSNNLILFPPDGPAPEIGIAYVVGFADVDGLSLQVVVSLGNDRFIHFYIDKIGYLFDKVSSR